VEKDKKRRFPLQIWTNWVRLLTILSRNGICRSLDDFAGEQYEVFEVLFSVDPVIAYFGGGMRRKE
jgi:hypothetical protein